MKRLLTLALALGLSAGLSAQQSASTGPVSLTSATCPGSGCVALPISGYGVVGFQVAGTYSGTISFEGSIDGSNWVAMTVYPSNSTTGVTTTTSTGVWSGGVGGLQAVRARMSSYTSGTATVSLLSAIVSARVGSGGTGGSSVVCGDTQVFFADGANTQACQPGLTYVKATKQVTVLGDFQVAGNAQIPGLFVTDNNGGAPNTWQVRNFNNLARLIYTNTSSLNWDSSLGRIRFGDAGGDGVVLDSNMKWGWTNGTAAASTLDLGVYRNGAGVLEVNNGTPAAYADLATRHAFASNRAGVPVAVSNTSANSCGTSAATIAGADEAFRITVGATAGTSCTVTFGTSLTNPPVCWAYDETTTSVKPSVVPTTTTVVIAGTFTAGDKVAGGCRPFM